MFTLIYLLLPRVSSYAASLPNSFRKRLVVPAFCALIAMIAISILWIVLFYVFHVTTWSELFDMVTLDPADQDNGGTVAAQFH